MQARPKRWVDLPAHHPWRLNRLVVQFCLWAHFFFVLLLLITEEYKHREKSVLVKWGKYKHCKSPFFSKVGQGHGQLGSILVSIYFLLKSLKTMNLMNNFKSPPNRTTLQLNIARVNEGDKITIVCFEHCRHEQLDFGDYRSGQTGN